MNPLFQDYQLRGTTQGNPVFMDKPQLDVLRMLVQGFEEDHSPQWLDQVLRQIAPRSRTMGVESKPVAMGIRG